jgi:hypothetical protein
MFIFNWAVYFFATPSKLPALDVFSSFFTDFNLDQVHSNFLWSLPVQQPYLLRAKILFALQCMLQNN